MTKTALLLSTALLPFAATAAAAQEAPPPAPETSEASEQTPPEDDFHGDRPIVVSAPYVKNLDLLAGTSALSGSDLAAELEPQIGDSLTSLPGVSATSFAPGVSRPVLRGFQGARVAVLTDGLGALDASQTSADHAVSIDPLTAERVEVLHGPAVLLYGGNAIGGAVNIIDKRIPRAMPESPFHLDALAGYRSATDGWFAGGSLDIPLGGNMAFHVDASHSKGDDVRIPGYALTPGLRAETLADAAEERAEGHDEEADELEELANARGTVPNSFNESMSAGAGLTFLADGGSIGLSVGYFDSDYGVPARPGAGHHHDPGMGTPAAPAEEEGPVSIGLKQYRADLRVGVDLGTGFFERLNLRAGYSDYKHTEFEGDEIGTRFLVDGIESRVELVQADHGGWRGVIGGQFLLRDFEAIGAEAFVPKNDIRTAAIFTVQEAALGPFDLEAAARYENVVIEAQPVSFDRSFDAFSAAIGLGYEFAPGFKIGGNVARSERAPAPEELLSDGPHIATQAYEVGNPAFDTEKSWGGEVYLRYADRDYQLSLTGFATWFDGYIYDAATGAEEDGLPVFRYFQQDARYYGFEMSGSARLASFGAFDIVADTVADYVRATVEGAGPVPRIPPLRILGGLEAQSDAIDARAEVEWVDGQNRVAAFETPTEGFTMVNASLAWRPFGKGGGVTILGAVDNIFDVTARRHASFTKDFVPLAGRNAKVTIKLSF